MKNKIDIDFKILLKKMRSELTESQQLIFEQWTSQSSRNQRYFENLSRYFVEGSNLNLTPESMEEDWKKLDSAFTVLNPRILLKNLVARN